MQIFRWWNVRVISLWWLVSHFTLWSQFNRYMFTFRYLYQFIQQYLVLMVKFHIILYSKNIKRQKILTILEEWMSGSSPLFIFSHLFFNFFLVLDAIESRLHNYLLQVALMLWIITSRKELNPEKTNLLEKAQIVIQVVLNVHRRMHF